MAYAKGVKGFADHLVDDGFDGFGPAVEGGHGRENDRPCLGDRDHVLKMNE
jgi:hypothetical protein